MIEFHDLKVFGRYRYLWLKYVTGVNLNYHCASCLKGEYSNYFGVDLRDTEVICLNEHPARIVYLCGVAKPYSWDRNLHVAMVDMPGDSFAFAEKGMSARVLNAARIPVTRDAMEELNHPKIGLDRYHTCRNWQFANFLEYTGAHLSKQ
jgi:hypothetical protein